MLGYKHFNQGNNLMARFLKTTGVMIIGVFLVVLASHFSAPEKGLLSGSGLRFRIALAELFSVLREGVYTGYVKVWSAPQDDRYKIGVAESYKLKNDLSTAYSKNLFLDYVNQMKTMTAELLKTVRDDTNTLSAPDEVKAEKFGPFNITEYARAGQGWIVLNEKRLNAIQSVNGDQAEEQAKAELPKLEQELRSALGDLEKKLIETGYAQNKTQELIKQPAEQLVQMPEKKVEPVDPVKKPEPKDIAPAPAKIVARFVDRYSNKDVRQTPYYFKNIKVIKTAETARPSVYCITFKADVYHKHDNKPWDKSPVVLNVIAVMNADAVLSTYESFAPNPSEYPRDGGCVRPVWGVHDYKWDEICPYGCLSKKDPSSN